MSSSAALPDVEAYRSVQESAAWVDRSGRVRLEIAGPDRARFLHNLTTNDVKRLAVGYGQESFVTSPQGKVLAYVTLIATEIETILLRTDRESLESLLPHLQKYGVFDDVAIEDVSSTTFEFHVAGPSTLARLGFELPPEGSLRNSVAEFAGVSLRVIRESPTGRPGITLVGPIEGAGSVISAIREAGLPQMDAATWEALRIEAGTPVSGVDVTLTHLPQEVGRDSMTINFVKGCYLGQETVARLDALGHVNRILRGFQFEGTEAPPIGTTLAFEGKVVGSVTSSAISPGWGRPIGLGFVRVAQAGPGTKLIATVEGIGEIGAFVHELPMLATEPA